MTINELAARLQLHYALQLLQLDVMLAQLDDWYQSREGEVETLQTYLRRKHESKNQSGSPEKRSNC